ncbi:restriction endonuclease subunit S, partial [Priestia megaterium]
VQEIKKEYVTISKNTVMVSKEKVEEQPQIQLKKNDLVFSKDGSLGFAAVISEELNDTYKMCTSSTLARIRLLKEINPYYLNLVLNSDVIKAQISYYLSGIAQPHINQEYIKQLEIPILDEFIQEQIGEKMRMYEKASKQSLELITEAKKDVEDLIKATFDESKLIKQQ